MIFSYTNYIHTVYTYKHIVVWVAALTFLTSNTFEKF